MESLIAKCARRTLLARAMWQPRGAAARVAGGGETDRRCRATSDENKMPARAIPHALRLACSAAVPAYLYHATRPACLSNPRWHPRRRSGVGMHGKRAMNTRAHPTRLLRRRPYARTQKGKPHCAFFSRAPQRNRVVLPCAQNNRAPTTELAFDTTKDGPLKPT